MTLFSRTTVTPDSAAPMGRATIAPALPDELISRASALSPSADLISRASVLNIAPERLERMEARPNTPFLITGLPRSRTAWFAAVCTGNGSVCYHEPQEDPITLLKTIGHERIGISDSGAGMRLAEILQAVQPKVLIIDRPIDEVEASMRVYAGEWAAPDLRERLEALQAALAVTSPLIKRVAYADLGRIEVVRDCLHWLEIRPLNLEQMMHLNIQSDLSYNLDRLKGV